jgi:hypothetical protein
MTVGGLRSAGLGQPRSWFSVPRWLRSRLFRVAGVRGERRGDFAAYVQLVAHLADQVASTESLVLKPTHSWVNTGITLATGESVTVLTRGELWMTKALGVGLDATQALWWRIGDGPARAMRGRCDVLGADTTGTLQLLVAEAGRITETGDLDRAVRPLPLHGELEVVLVRWQQDPVAALEAAAAVDPELFGALHLRTQRPVLPPAGWSYHPRIGDGNLFWQNAADGTIGCLSRADVGILRRPVDVEIAAHLVLSWSWRVEQLPSRIAEDLLAAHDYLAVALEFDDGRDLSWMWSATLAEETSFACPLPYWNNVETHVVIRSGTADLGHWVDERREVAQDVKHYLSGPAPRRVVAIWLVANTALQGGAAAFRLRDLRLSSDTGPLVEQSHTEERTNP